jgi:hypothetical protein
MRGPKKEYHTIDEYIVIQMFPISFGKMPIPTHAIGYFEVMRVDARTNLLRL